jgi:hypothetical protein
VSSDIELSFLSSWRAIDLKLHAHKAVLAAGSTYFKRELQKPEFQKLEHSQELDNVVRTLPSKFFCTLLTLRTEQ